MHSEILIKQVWRYIWRQDSSVFKDTLGGPDRLNSEIHSEIVIEQVWRCTWRPIDRVNLEMHLPAVIEQDWRCTWRPWSCKLGGHNWASLVIHFAKCNRVSLDKYLEMVDGGHAGCWDYIHKFVDSQTWQYGKVIWPLSSHGDLAEGGRSYRESGQKLHSGVKM